MNKPSCYLKRALLSAALLAAGGAAQAAIIASIDFSEVPLGTEDPLIQGFQFSANAAASFADTITEDALSPGDPYLSSGLDDSPNNYVPPLDTSLIRITSSGVVGGSGNNTTISLDAAYFTSLPSGSTLLMEALLGGVVEGNATFTETSPTPGYRPLQITLSDVGFDTIRLYDAADAGFAFRIDNVMIDVSPSGPGPGPGPMPEPSSLLLMGIGALGMGWAGRRRQHA